MVAVPAIGLLIELYCWVRRGLSASYFPLFLGACGKQTASRFFLIIGKRLQNGKRFREAFLRFYFASDFRLRQGSTDLLCALPAPDQNSLLQHQVQDAGDGVAFDIDVLSQLAGADFLEMIHSAGPALGDISV